MGGAAQPGQVLRVLPPCSGEMWLWLGVRLLLNLRKE